MLALAFKRLCFISDKVIVRNLRNRRLPNVPNPGLQHRIDAFQSEGLKIEDEDAEEFIEQSESDFHNVGEAYKVHKKEKFADKSELRHHIIKEKYFKENMPNLLTWSEKEQIRYLAQTEPDVWSPEKIAESFPVTVPVVKKLLKYPWKPASKERIARHDASAMRNWRELKEGSLNIPKDMRQHFLRFSERTIPPLSDKSIKIDLTQNEKLGEFESIIRRCAAKDEQQSNEKTNAENTKETDLALAVNTSKHGKTKDYKRVTLDELTDRIKQRLDKGREIDINDSLMLDTVSKENQIQIIEGLKEIELNADDNKISELTEFKETVPQLKEIDYTKRIRIPKQAYKKGATYKVNDCYYDDDGKFLYRVLGMTN